MFRDPTQAINAPPPRYLLESDSSDEEGQGIYPSNSTSGPGPTSSRQKPDPKSGSTPTPCSIEYKGPIPSSSSSLGNINDDVDLLLGVGQAGRYLLRLAGGLREEEDVAFEVVYGGVSVGRGYRLTSTNSSSSEGISLVIVVDDHGVPAEGLHTIAETLIQSFKAHSLTVVTTYLPSIYILDSETETPKAGGKDNVPPIRYLPVSPTSCPLEALHKAGTEVYNSPNHVTGITAALVSLAFHPSSSIPTETPITVLVLPLPLSSVPLADFKAVLAVSCPSLLDIIKVAPGHRHWLETDDEPYVAPGMGRSGKILGRTDHDHHHKEKENFDSMYM